MADGKPVDQRFRRHLQTDELEDRLRLGVNPRAAEPSEKVGLAAQKNIRGHIQVITQIEFLMNERDAAFESCANRVKLHRFSFHHDFAMVWLEDTGQNFHQRALARSIFANNGEDLPGPDGQTHIIEGQHASESLGDVTDLQQIS